MDTRKIKLLVLLIIAMSCLQFQCRRIFGCTEQKYSFNLPIVAYPDKEEVLVGDTLWFEIKHSNLLTDHITGEILDYSGAANLGSAIEFSKLTDTLFSIKSVQKFDYILEKGVDVGRSFDLERLKEYLFVEEDGYYLFKLGIVPKEPGIYLVLFSSAKDVYRHKDECTKASFEMAFFNTDQHYPLNPNYRGGNLVGRDYYFSVK